MNGPTACVECGVALPPAARFCPSCAAPVDARAPEEERKLATVVFADLVGSTALAGSRDPEHTRALLDRFYEAMADEIGAAGGTVEKFAGDAVMAAFGAPAAFEDHAERALTAALAMRSRLEELFGDALGLRIGVNTGELVVGRPRVGSSFASGDAVNVAARLEQAAAPGEILVGERTASVARRRFEFGEPFTVAAKGKPDGVACRHLLRRSARGGGATSGVFVGRAGELDSLRAIYGGVLERGSPELVVVVGEAGVGKTRLVGEFVDDLAESGASAALALGGRCLSHGRGNTYWPLAEVLRELLGITEHDAPSTVLERLRGREILALSFGLDVADAVHPRVARARLYGAWRDLAEELSRDRPLVLVVEDLHWAEEPLLELLQHLSAHVRGRLLVLATSRPELLERRPGSIGSVLGLEPLSEHDAERVVDGVARGLPSTLRELIVSRAEGNPFFVEEFVAMLVDQGLLERADGSWSARDLPDDVALPDSIQNVLAARIDLLSASEKVGLQAASVVGRRFWAASVRALLDGADPHLDALVQRDLVRPRGMSDLAGEREYAFKHALTRDVAYGTLTRARRARLHAAFAEWLEERGEGRDEHAALLAHHYAQAADREFADLAWRDDAARRDGLRRQAMAWLRRAADLAAARFAVDEALALLDRALVLEPAAEERVALLRDKARFHMLSYDVAGFRRSLEAALELAPAPSVAGQIYAELAFYGVGRPYMWRQPPSPDVGALWLAKALELSEPDTAARGYALLARALSEPETAADTAVRAHDLGKAVADHSLVAYACEAQTLAASRRRRYEEACDWAERALEATRALSDPRTIGHQHWNAGFVYLRAGRIAPVRALAATYDRLASSINPHEEVHAVALYALLESVLGRWDALARLATRAEAATAANEDFPCQFNWRTLLVCALGFAYLGNGRDEAQRLEELARAGAVVAGPLEREPAFLRLALVRGDLDDARRILASLPATIDAFGLDAPAARLDALAALGDADRVEAEAAPFAERPSYVRPFALRALGTTRRDAGLITEAAGLFEDMGLAWRADETRALITNTARG